MGYLFRSPSVRKQIMVQGQGISRINLAPARLSEVEFLYPTSTEEQQKIADFLSSMDNAIAAAKDELAGYQELKKGLLQQMFA